MGSTSSKDHDGHSPVQSDVERVRQTMRRIDSVGVTTPGGGLYPEEAKVMHTTDAMAMDIDHPTGTGDGGLNQEQMGGTIVPMVFKWEHGGRNVCITGTFNGWSKQVRMHRSGNDFTYIANLTRGKHAYKYVVDEEWRFAPDQPTVADIEGNINNFVDVSDFIPLGEMDERSEDKDTMASDNMYGYFMPDIDDYTKEPPPLPPHLRHIILNKVLYRRSLQLEQPF